MRSYSIVICWSSRYDLVYPLLVALVLFSLIIFNIKPVKCSIFYSFGTQSQCLTNITAKNQKLRYSRCSSSKIGHGESRRQNFVEILKILLSSSKFGHWKSKSQIFHKFCEALIFIKLAAFDHSLQSIRGNSCCKYFSSYSILRKARKP